MKFNVKYLREFDGEIEAATLEHAGKIAQNIAKRTNSRVLSIYPEGYVEPESDVVKPTPDATAARNAGLARNLADHDKPKGAA